VILGHLVFSAWVGEEQEGKKNCSEKVDEGNLTTLVIDA